MKKAPCTGQGTEVELFEEPFQTVTCPVCGRSNLGAASVHRGSSKTTGKIPIHTAALIRPDDIPEVRFQSHEWWSDTVQRTYEENNRKNRKRT